MEELELFKNRISSYIDKAYTGGVSLLMFLDEAKLGILNQEIKKNPTLNISYYGGFKNSDRVRAIISSDIASSENYKIVVFKIIYNKRYYTISHRSVLGSLMSLGIKRECIGDIIIDNNLDAYFACTKEISGFIKENLHSIGGAQIELIEEVNEIENIVRYEDKLHFLSSLRLDVIIAAAYNFSRSEALDYIKNGLVFINHINIFNPSHIVKELDEISVRHKGRVKLSSINGNSKSGRLAVTLSKRV